MIVHVAGRAIPTDPRVAFRSVRAEALSLPRAMWLWLGFLGVLLLVGAVGAVRSLFPGDKGVGTTPSFEWGILIVGYVFFAVTTSGLCLASSLGTVFGIERFRPLEKRHAILAVLCLLTAFGIIALDLHYPVRLAFGAALNPSPTSPMWWMGVCYGFYLCVLLVEVWSMFTDHPTIHQVACTAAMCTAIVAPMTLGAVFGVLASRAMWFGPFTPVLMVSTAFLAGTSLLGIVFYFVHRLRLAGSDRAAAVAIPSIRLLLTAGLILVSALVARQVVAGLAGGEPGLSEATQALLAGPLALQFWGLRVIGGLVLPAVLIALPRTRTPVGTFVASVLIMVGVFADRLTFVSAGQVAPTTAVSGVVSTPYAAYSPSPVEIAIIVGALAFVAFVYTMAERYLDLREADAHGALSLSRLLPRRFARSVAPAIDRHGLPGQVPAHIVAPAPAVIQQKPHVEPLAADAIEPAAADAIEPAAADAVALIRAADASTGDEDRIVPAAEHVGVAAEPRDLPVGHGAEVLEAAADDSRASVSAPADTLPADSQPDGWPLDIEPDGTPPPETEAGDAVTGEPAAVDHGGVDPAPNVTREPLPTGVGR